MPQVMMERIIAVTILRGLIFIVVSPLYVLDVLILTGRSYLVNICLYAAVVIWGISAII
jgi:hypothetical protein